jgi:hypothetical protein
MHVPQSCLRGRACPGASAEENAAAMKALEADLQNLGLAYFPGEGADPKGLWPAETSFLVMGMSHEQAISSAKAYRQNAVLISRQDAVPSLLVTVSAS